MFYNCFKLENLNLSSFKADKAFDMSYMFCHLSTMTSLDIPYFNTEKVEDMAFMFANSLN